MKLSVINHHYFNKDLFTQFLTVKLHFYFVAQIF